jgi:hypothetical protein
MPRHIAENIPLTDGACVVMSDGLSISKRSTTKIVGFTNDCDFVCDGACDNVQIQQAIDAMPAVGGQAIWLS